MDKHELIVKAEHVYLDHGIERSDPLGPAAVKVQILDGDNLVAETTLDALVQKFLIVSSQYAQLLEIMGSTIQGKTEQDGQIVIPGEK